MKNILLVNPWIYDFAAHDFGNKPVGILRIGEYLRRGGYDVSFIDCLGSAPQYTDEFGFSKIRKEKAQKPAAILKSYRPFFRYGIPVSSFMEQLSIIKKPDHIFVTSGMTYWYPGVFLAISLLKKHFPDVKITLGGIYATLCYGHARKYSGADAVWKGDYLPNDHFLESSFYPAYDLLRNKQILPIQLTSGCPHNCSYCASKTLKPKVFLKDPVDLFEEIMFFRKIYGARSFVFYDDALLFDSEYGIKRFLRLIAASGHDFTFHTPNGLHARFIDDELAHLFKAANFRDLRISLETSDYEMQMMTGGKVTLNDLKLALRNLREAGYSKNDLGIYILIGAPWLPIDKSMDDVMLVNSMGAKAVLASYSPIPKTRDYALLLKKGILKKDTDPLWHNKTIFSELLSPSYGKKIQEIRRITAKLNHS